MHVEGEALGASYRITNFGMHPGHFEWKSVRVNSRHNPVALKYRTLIPDVELLWQISDC
jgi:hypothetical protein